MKGAICYYSGSGNTRLACRSIADRVRAAEFDLIDITKQRTPELDSVDVVGFATFTDFLGPPHLFETFVAELPEQAGKLAFVFNTYGFLSGRTLKVLAEMVAARGFRVICGHALHTPESYPPQILRGLGAPNAPNPRELGRLDTFVAELDGLLRHADAGGGVRSGRVRIGFVNSLIPRFRRTKSRDDMGRKHVIEASCTECGLCARVCPYGAIELAPKPVFDESACYGCWACYNHCPEQAIHTARFEGECQYPRPNKQLREKLKV